VACVRLTPEPRKTRARLGVHSASACRKNLKGEATADGLGLLLNVFGRPAAILLRPNTFVFGLRRNGREQNGTVFFRPSEIRPAAPRPDFFRIPLQSQSDCVGRPKSAAPFCAAGFIHFGRIFAFWGGGKVSSVRQIPPALQTRYVSLCLFLPPPFFFFSIDT